MVQCTFFRHVDDSAANLNIAERILWVVGKQRHFWVASHVLFFAKPAHGVDQHVVSLAVAPDRSGLRLTIGHDGRQRHAIAAVQQISMRFRKGNSFMTQLWTPSGTAKLSDPLLMVPARLYLPFAM